MVLEPANFDDSQKVADYLRNNQPVVVNFEGTEGLVTKRMTTLFIINVYAGVDIYVFRGTDQNITADFVGSNE